MPSPTAELSGRTILVTGTTAGIGRATAENLAGRGAHVVCVNRDPVRGQAALDALKQKTGSANVELMLCDLSSLQSIRDFAAEFKRRHARLDVLVNNAGTLNPEKKKTVDGYELTFALNHLSYFLLTHLLLDVLEASAPARIINLASEAQRMGGFDFDDLMFDRRPYRPFGAYSQSKLANIVFTVDLAERLAGTGITVNAVHPGGVSTNFGNEAKGLLGIGMKIFKRFALTPEQGAATSIFLATAPQGATQTGRYWAKSKPLRLPKAAQDPETRRRLWEVSEQLTGLTRAKQS